MQGVSAQIKEPERLRGSSLRLSDLKAAAPPQPSILSSIENNADFSQLAIPEIERLKKKFLEENRAVAKSHEMTMLREGAKLIRGGHKVCIDELSKRYNASGSPPVSQQTFNQIANVLYGVYGVSIFVGSCFLVSKLGTAALWAGLGTGVFGGMILAGLSTALILGAKDLWKRYRAGANYERFMTPVETRFFPTLRSIKEQVDKLAKAQSFNEKQSGELEKVLCEKAALEFEQRAAHIEKGPDTFDQLHKNVLD